MNEGSTDYIAKLMLEDSVKAFKSRDHLVKKLIKLIYTKATIEELRHFSKMFDRLADEQERNNS